jgi:hypothetical protein
MPAAAFWALIGSLTTAAVALLGMYIAQRTGFLHLSIATKAHSLNVLKAAPKVGSSIRIEERQVNPPAFPPFYYLITQIYNEGDLAAQQLKGHWKLLCSNHTVLERNVPIMRDFLGTSPYNLEPCQIEGTTVPNAMRGEVQFKVLFNVHIDFDYFGLSHDEPYHYHAEYEFNPEQRQMVRSDR